MYHEKKAVRRGGTSNQIRTSNATKNRPLTRKQSAALVSEEVSNSDKFVLIELTLNKKLLIVEYNELIKLNEVIKIKLGSNVLIKSNGGQSMSASIFCIGR